MPRVPTYQPFQVQPTVGPGPAFQAPSGPGPAQISGEQLQQMGGAISEVGEQLGKYAQIQQERINRARFYEVQSELREVFRQEEQGLRSLKGAQLFDSDQPAFEKSRDFLETRRGEILDRLPNQVLRDAFQQEFSRQFEGFNDRMIIYEGEQFELYKSTTQDAAIEGAFRDAVLYVNAREENFGTAFNIVRDKVTDEGLTGIGAEEAASELITSMVSDQVDELIRQGRFADAIDLLNSATLTRGIDEIGILAPEGTTGFGAIKEDDLIALRYGVNKAEIGFNSEMLASQGDISEALELINDPENVLSSFDRFEMEQAVNIVYDRFLENKKAEDQAVSDEILANLQPLLEDKSLRPHHVAAFQGLLEDSDFRIYMGLAHKYAEDAEKGDSSDDTYNTILYTDIISRFRDRSLTYREAQREVLSAQALGNLNETGASKIITEMDQLSDSRYAVAKNNLLNIYFPEAIRGIMPEVAESRNLHIEAQHQMAENELFERWPELREMSYSEQAKEIQDIALRAKAMGPEALLGGLSDIKSWAGDDVKIQTQADLDKLKRSISADINNGQITEQQAEARMRSLIPYADALGLQFNND